MPYNVSRDYVLSTVLQHSCIQAVTYSYFLTTACVPYTFVYRQRPLLAARCTTCGRSNVDFLRIHWNSLSAIQVGLKEGGKRQRRADVNWTTKENKLQLRRKTFDSSNMWQPASERLQVSYGCIRVYCRHTESEREQWWINVSQLCSQQLQPTALGLACRPAPFVAEYRNWLHGLSLYKESPFVSVRLTQ